MRQRGRARNGLDDAGVSLLELLIAMAITMLVTGAALGLLDPAQGAFQAQPEAADLQQRLRVALDALARVVTVAGAGLDDGAGAAPYNQLAAVMPYRHGQTRDDGAAGIFYRPDALTVVSVPAPSIADRESHTYYVRPDGAGALQLMHYDGEVTDSPVVDNVVRLAFEYLGDPLPPGLSGSADPDSPVSTYGPSPPPLDVDFDLHDEYGPGENCLFTVTAGGHLSRLSPVGDDGAAAVLDPSMLVDGPWCPTSTSPDRYDADLLRVRLVRITIRLQAASAFRGPAGPLFERGGTATSASRRVPDRGITFDIAPPNLRSPGAP